MAWYKTGTVAVTSGSGEVVGTDTEFMIHVHSGDIFTVDRGRMYEILSITDDTHLTLMEAYAGTTNATASYAVIVNFTNTLNATLALRMMGLVDKYEDWIDATYPGAFEADADGNFMPKVGFEADVNFEYDGNGDLIPKGAT